MDLEQIGNMILEKIPFQKVSVCYLAAANPTFDEGIQQAKMSGNSQVFVIPYLLFTGVLMREMEYKINTFGGTGPSFHLCHYLGYHDLLKEVLKERVNEAFKVAVKI